MLMISSAPLPPSRVKSPRPSFVCGGKYKVSPRITAGNGSTSAMRTAGSRYTTPNAHRKFARIQSLIRRERHRANVTFPALRFDPRRLPGAVPCLRGSFRIPQNPVPARPNQKRHQRHSQQRPPFLRSVQPNNFRFSSRQYKMIPVTTGVSTGKIFIT